MKAMRLNRRHPNILMINWSPVTPLLTFHISYCLVLFFSAAHLQCRIDYKQCYSAHRQSPSQHSLTQLMDAHNAFVQQLHATNAMLEAYHCDTLPQLMQELEEIYTDLCNTVAETVLQGADAISAKVKYSKLSHRLVQVTWTRKFSSNQATDQVRRYDTLAGQCKAISPPQDLVNFSRSLPLPPNAQRMPKLKIFVPPGPVDQNDEYGVNKFFRHFFKNSI